MNLKKTFDTLISAIRDGVHVEVTRTEYERDRLFIGGVEYPVEDNNYNVRGEDLLVAGYASGGRSRLTIGVETNEDVTADFHIREEN